MRPRVLLLAALLPTGAFGQDLFQFQSPTGNIHCAMIGGDFGEDPRATCELIALTPSFPPNSGCDGNYGDAFVVFLEGKGEPVCHGDRIVDPSSPVLSYGKTMTKGVFSCTSEKSGVTCTNGEGHGFTVAKAKQRVF